VSSVANGSLALNADGSFTYTPQTNFSGVDTFTYRVSDGFGGTSDATVTINVHTTNHPPSCGDAHANLPPIWSPNGTFYPVDIQGVTDPDSDPLTIVITGGPHGTGSGIWQDEPVGNSGPDGFVGETDHLPYVRAKRAGSGDGRVYHIFFTATDLMGLTCSGSVRTAVVAHDQSGSFDLDAIDQGPLYDSTIVGP
jgi:hypothetical protein